MSVPLSVIILHVHAYAEQLISNLMLTISGMYPNRLPLLSSSGPNVLKALKQKGIQEINKDIVVIDTCTIDKIDNPFSATFDAFGSNMEILGLVLFLYSRTQNHSETISWLKGKLRLSLFLRYVESSWTTLEDIIDRIVC